MKETHKSPYTAGKIESTNQEAGQEEVNNAKFFTPKRKYTTAQEGVESTYVSEDEIYSANEVLGKGANATARLLKSLTKSKVVLHSNKEDLDKEEIDNKIRFYNILYPNKVHFELYSNQKNYRLILPKVPGKAYNDSNIRETLETLGGQIYLFESTCIALKDLHEKGLVFIDLKEDNIHYDEKSKQSFLLDGGTSSEIGKDMSDKFASDSTNEVLRERKQYEHIAPECFFVAKSQKPIANPSMDVYAIGKLMEHLIVTVYQNPTRHDIKSLIEQCISSKPENRPNIDNILDYLSKLKEQYQDTLAQKIEARIEGSKEGFKFEIVENDNESEDLSHEEVPVKNEATSNKCGLIKIKENPLQMNDEQKAELHNKLQNKPAYIFRHPMYLYFVNEAKDISPITLPQASIYKIRILFSDNNLKIATDQDFKTITEVTGHVILCKKSPSDENKILEDEPKNTKRFHK